MNSFYPDDELVKLFGKRGNGTALFEPVELGWLCPENEKHGTTWSEFNDHIWCYPCQMDYFTLLCPKKYIQGHPFMSKTVVEEEIEKMQPLMKGWTLEKYAKLSEKPLEKPPEKEEG